MLKENVTTQALPQETRETSNKQSTLHLKELGKELMQPKVIRRMKIIKIQAEIKRNRE